MKQLVIYHENELKIGSIYNWTKVETIDYSILKATSEDEQLHNPYSSANNYIIPTHPPDMIAMTTTTVRHGKKKNMHKW